MRSGQCQTFLCDGWAAHGATQALQLIALMRLSHHTRMQGEADMGGHSAAGVGLILSPRQGLQREDLAPLLGTGGNAIGH